MTDPLTEAVARALKQYLGQSCGMVLKPHALDGLAQAAIDPASVEVKP